MLDVFSVWCGPWSAQDCLYARAGERAAWFLLLVGATCVAGFRLDVAFAPAQSATAVARWLVLLVSAQCLQPLTLSQYACVPTRHLAAPQVRVPWRLAVQLLGPPSTHTLLAAAVPSGETAGPGSSAGSSGGGGGGLEAEPSALLAQQAQRLQSLSLQDSQAAGGADLGAAADSRDLAMLLLRSLPPLLVLPAGQRCTALVQLQSQAAVQVDVLSVDLEAAEGAAAAAAVASAAQLAAAGGQGSAQPAASAAAADTLGKGDIFTAAFSLTSASAAPAELPSLGFLRLRWRRTQRRPQLVAAAARGGSRLTPAAAAAEAEAANLIGSRPGSPTAAAAAPAGEVLVPLPPASFLAPLLTAELRYPPAATAGQAAALELLLSNGGATNQEVAVAVGDPHGFLLSGEEGAKG